MKGKAVVGVLLVVGAIAIFVLGGLFTPSINEPNKGEFLRLHIRANSNSHEDQAVKYKVKSAIIDDLTPIFSTVTTRQGAMVAVQSNINRIQNVGNRVLQNNGFTGKSTTAVVRSEFFPTRNYGNLTLPAGNYDALIISLGSGAGDNWWCVIYPPLCFLGNSIGGERGVIYRSRLNEIIRRFFN